MTEYPCEITVTIKGEEKTYKQKYFTYETVMFHPESDIIKGFVEETRKNAKIEIEEVKVRALLVIK